MKVLYLPANLLVAVIISSFILGSIVGTVTTYLLFDIKPPSKELTAVNDTMEKEVLVTKVIDGDTIVVEWEKQEIAIRYLGIDAPENKGVEETFYGKEAQQKNEEFVGGKKVKIVYEEKLRSFSNRLLAYVFIEDILINAEMLKGGYASVFRRNSNDFPVHRHHEYFVRLEQEARTKQLGIWNAKAKKEWEQKHGVITFLYSGYYIADDKFFHRPQCPKVEGIQFKLYYYVRQNAIAEKKPCSVCKP